MKIRKLALVITAFVFATNICKAQNVGHQDQDLQIKIFDSTLIQSYKSEGQCFNARVTRCSYKNLKLKIAFRTSGFDSTFSFMYIFNDTTNCGFATFDKKHSSRIKDSIIIRNGINEYYLLLTKKVGDFFSCAIVPTDRQQADCIIDDETNMQTPYLNFKKETTSLGQIMAASKKKYAYLNFWTSYCPPCIEHIPDYNKIAESENILLININCNNGWDSAAISQIKKYNFKGIHLKSNELIQKECNQNGYSYGAMIDKKGKIIHQGIRYHSKEVILFNKRRKKVT
jgi:thiol-disulfide isomerase/thioredoxin